MTRYYVVSVKPFSRKGLIIEAKSRDEAIEISNNRKEKYKSDVLIISKEDGKNDFVLEKYGYYKVYNFLNKILLVIATMIILLFSYLYYKYLKK